MGESQIIDGSTLHVELAFQYVAMILFSVAIILQRKYCKLFEAGNLFKENNT